MKYRLTGVKLAITTCMSVLLLPASTLGQTSNIMEHTLVTGSYSTIPASDLTSSVTFLDFADIQALNKRNVADVLKTIAGVLVEEQGGPGGLTAVSIRGGEANFTLVLIDGVPMNDPTNSRGGGFDFSNLNLASVQRIELIRGPQSAIYGSDALAGVINIITRQLEKGHHQRARFEWGEFDYHNYSVAASGKTNEFAYADSLLTGDAGEALEGSNRQTDEANASLNWQPSIEHAFSISYRHLDGTRNSYPEQSGGPVFAVIDELDESDFKDRTLAADWRADFNDKWRSSLNFNRFKHKEIYTSPGIYPFSAVPPNGASTTFDREQVRWVNTLKPGKTYVISVGADYSKEQGVNVGYLDLGFAKLPTDFELDRKTTALFGDIHINVLPRLLLQASARYDNPDDFSGETSLNLGARYELTPKASLTANLGEGFKLPSFFALGHALVGNPGLQPETAKSWDLSVEWAATDTVNLISTYFSNVYRDLIDFDAAQFMFVNREKVVSNGVEFQFSWTPLDRLDLSAHTTYTHIDANDSSAYLLGRPDWRAGATAEWRASTDWTTTLDLQWTGEQYASSLRTGETVIQVLNDYHRVDWNLSWQVGKHAMLELAVDNLFDEPYFTAVGFPAPGRLFRLAFNCQR